MSTDGRPDFELVLCTKDKSATTGKRIYHKIGVGWYVFDEAGVSIKLNPGTVLDWRMMDDFFLTLRKPFRQEDDRAPAVYNDNYDQKDLEDIPF